MNDLEFSCFKFLKLKCRQERPNNSAGSCSVELVVPQEIRSPLLNLRKSWTTVKRTAESCRMHLNLVNDAKFGSLKFLKLKNRKRDQISQPFCRISSPQGIRSSLLKLMKFWKPKKRPAASCRMDWYLMNDAEFGSFKFLKYKRGDQKIQPSCWIGSPQEIKSPSWI